MTFLNTHRIVSELCRATKKWAVILEYSTSQFGLQGLFSAAPYLKAHDIDAQVLADLCSGGTVCILCETEDEADSLYEKTVGKDGTTLANNYSGGARVYALTVSSEGEFHRENC